MVLNDPCTRDRDTTQKYIGLISSLVVSLNARDGTHPNLGTGARFRAVDPGMLPRRGRTTIRWSSRHDRPCLPPLRGSQGATCVATRPLAWVPASARVLVIACEEAPDDNRRA